MTFHLDPVGGVAPHSWRLTTIGELCDQNGGEVQTGPFGSQLHAEDYVADGVPSVMPKDIVGDQISTNSIARVPEKDAARLAVHRLRVGDVVYARRGDIGRRAIVTTKEEGWLCGTGCLRIRLNAPDVSPEYLLAYLGHPRVRSWVESKAQGATMLNLNTTILRSVPLRVPPLKEQRRIADILDKADGIRRKRKEAIDLTEELLRSAFLEMFGEPVTNPKGWTVAPLGDVCDVGGGLQVTHARAENPVVLPYLRVANVFRDRLELSEIKEIRVTEAEAVRAALRVGDVLVVEGHGNPDELGRAAVWGGEIPKCTHQNHLIRVRPKENVLEPRFLSAYLNSGAGRAQMLRLGKTTSGLNTISTNNVRGVTMLVPPLTLQRSFGRLVEAKSRVLASIVASAAVAQDLFDSLVHRAFRGELTGKNGSDRPQVGAFGAGAR